MAHFEPVKIVNEFCGTPILPCTPLWKTMTKLGRGCSPSVLGQQAQWGCQMGDEPPPHENLIKLLASRKGREPAHSTSCTMAAFPRPPS